jgi:Fe-S-cluster containining protein
MKHLETDLSKIKQLATYRINENFRFRTFLKGKDGVKVDSIVHRLHKDIAAQIDCTLCGNCCCQLKPELHEKDIEKLSQIETITPENYIAGYCEKDDYGEIYLKTIPCRYLEGKKCSIYESRPKECRRFPYTDENEFISRLFGMISFYELCPIVFNLMEILKVELRFHR